MRRSLFKLKSERKFTFHKIVIFQDALYFQVYTFCAELPKSSPKCIYKNLAWVLKNKLHIQAFTPALF